MLVNTMIFHLELNKILSQQKPTQLMVYKDSRLSGNSPRFSTRLNPGMNRYDIIVISAPMRGALRSAVPADDVDYECFTFFFHVV